MIDKHISVVASIGVGISFMVAYYLYQRFTKKNWKHVGYLSQINFFPVKSCGVVYIEDAECQILGLKNGHFNDRTFMIIDDNGNYMSGRSCPKLVNIKPTITEKNITLKHENLPDLKLNLDSLEQSTDTLQCKIWNDLVNVINCGDAAAEWISKAILGRDNGMKLVYYPHKKSSRSVRKKFTINAKLTSKDCGAFADGSSYMLASSSSLEALNSQLKDNQIEIHQFRPNFVVNGCEPHDEDNWKRVQIGSTIFEVVLPCTRCNFVNVDPDTGLSNEYSEPLKTLKTYRQVNNKELRKIIGDSPKMGIQMVLNKQGNVKVGDPVYVIN